MTPRADAHGTAHPSSAPVRLQEVLPDPRFVERHARRIAAPPETVWDALHEVSLGDLLLARALMAVRSLPRRLTGRAGRDPLLSGRLLGGPVPVLAVERPHTVVAGAVDRPWPARGASQPLELDAAGLRAFSQPGWVKLGLDFTLEQDGRDTILRTETRVVATDARTRRLFRLYWFAIRAGSGLISRDLLRWVARSSKARALAASVEPGSADDRPVLPDPRGDGVSRSNRLFRPRGR